MQIDLRHLRAFITVAEELHFGHAAERLNLSQPPVSAAIKELEDQLGLLLFKRTSRRIELTREGSALLLDARAILHRVDILSENASKIAQGIVGTLAVGTTSLSIFSFLPQVLRRFNQDYPDVQIKITEATSDHIVKELEKGTIDVGCMFTMPLKVQGLTYRPIGRDLLMLALPANHSAAKLERVPLELLAEEKFLVFERESGPLMFDSMVELCMRHGFSPKTFTARFMSTILSLVSANMGVALVPECSRTFQREGTVYRPLQGPSSVVEHGAAWRTEDDSPVLRAFLRYLPEDLSDGHAATGEA